MPFNNVADITQFDLVNSRTCPMKFKDFQAPALFSSTFKALNLGEKNSSTFKDVWEPWKEYLYTTIYSMHSPKALRHGSHGFTCKLHHACISFPSIHQMVLPLTEVAGIQLQLSIHLSTSKG